MLRKLKPINALTGEIVEFICEVDLGTPVSDVTWERQGRTIRPNNRVTSSVTDKKLKLSIDNCSLEDAGTYSVRVSNKLGTVESEAALSVNSKYFCYNSSLLLSVNISF